MLLRRRRGPLTVLLLLAVRCLSSLAAAQGSAAPLPPTPAGEPTSWFLPAGVTYDPAVPTPEAFFGFPLGRWHLRTDQVHAYARAVAAAAPGRVTVSELGRTHEEKPLLLVTLTAPENHARLEELRRAHLARLVAGTNGATPPPTAVAPLIVDLGYSVHGNEPSAGNAVPAVLYHLAAAQGTAHDELLRGTIILLEPVRNPDGFDRFAQWANSHRGLAASPDPVTREHLEAWPRGRTNHYWFDLNRDWLPLVHPESRARLELFHRWRPHLLTDHHEMGSQATFFFQPGIPSRNNPLIPPAVPALTAQVGTFHQRALDALGSLYFSQQGYDDFYPGKGSTYPDLHGTVGILFEQASARGHVQETEHGPLLLSFAIRHQVAVSLSSLAATQALRRDFLALQATHTAGALAAAREGKVRAWVFGDDADPARAAAFLELLRRHRIEVRPLTTELTAGAAGERFTPGHAWVVRTEQPQFRLLHEIFAVRTEFPDPTFYDVSAWSPLFGYNLPAAALETAPAAGDPLPLDAAPPATAGRLIGSHVGAYAYLLDWRSSHAPRALHRLQRAGIYAKGALLPFAAETSAGPVTFAAGSVLVPVTVPEIQPPTLVAEIDRVVREDGVDIYALRTGLTPQGPDLGSASFVPLPLPRVALLTGEGVDAYDAGEAWHTLDQRVGLAVTHLDTTQVARADLARYHAIVLVDGNYDALLGDAAVDALRRWLRAGGTLVTFGGAAEWAAKKDLAKIEIVPAAPVETPRSNWATMDDAEARQRIAGAIFAADLDLTHPLGFGFTRRHLPLCKAGMLVLKPARSPYETVARYTDEPLLAGYASATNVKAIAGSAACLALPAGRGAVIALPDNPNFRGYWRSGERLFLNAVFYGRAIRGPRLAGDDDHAH